MKSIIFNLPKPGKDEDADPLAESLGSHAWLIGVFDGLGGAGSNRYTDRTGKSHTGAYLASRWTREAVREYFTNTPQLDQEDDLSIAIQGQVRQHIQKVAQGYEQVPSKLRGRLIRRFPTTLAVLYSKERSNKWSYSPHQKWELKNPWYEYTALWAGDSRCYALDENGLRQLTTDDLTTGNDALENLLHDSPLSNYVYAEDDFKVHVCSGSQSKPCAFLVATDGCFGYLPTPMHFEWLLLNSLQKAKDAQDWQEQIMRRVQAVTGDDASFALILWSDFQQFRDTVQKRTMQLEEEYIRPLDSPTANAHVRQELWGEYKLNYEHDLKVRG